MSPPVGGEQFSLALGGARATVTEVGASLREFSTALGPVIWSYRESELCSAGRGQVLMPWPNRIEDGSYHFGARSAQAALDEPDRGNAIHGLVRWLRWSPVERSPEAVTLECELCPQPGYPWRLACQVSYRIESESSIEIELSAVNLSAEGVPFGAGFHPYLDPGPAGADSVRGLRVPAKTRLVCDGRGIPRSSSSVLDTPYDLSDAKSLVGLALDDCFADLPAPWTVQLDRADGTAVEVWAGGAFRYVMCYTADTLSGSDRRRAVAVEPMTCAPNAFRSGEGLLRLEPGERFSARFGIRVLS